MRSLRFLIPGLLVLLFTGCAEGPLWKIGGYFPWVQAKWRAEEEIAETVHSRKARLRDLARNARGLSEAEKENVVGNLANLIENENIIQLRVDAAYTLGAINTASAEQVLKTALNDGEAEVRIAAVKALAERRSPSAAPELVRVLNSDTDQDVRAAAIRGLANYPSDQTVDALGQVLNEPTPALQYVAMKSLREITDAGIGLSVSRWKEYLASRSMNPNGSRVSYNPQAISN